MEDLQPSTVLKPSRVSKSYSLESLAVLNGILESSATQHPLIERLRLRLCSEGTNGAGFAKLQKRLRIMDRDGSRLISYESFRAAFQKCNIGFDDEECRTIFLLFAERDQVFLDTEEFFTILRGAINFFRRDLIEVAYQSLDLRGEGFISCELIIEKYDPTQHPDVRSKFKQSQEVFRDFLKNFEVGGEVDNRISRGEFFNFHFNLSAAIDDDAYFEDVLMSTWQLNSSLHIRMRDDFHPQQKEYGTSYEDDGYRRSSSRSDRPHSFATPLREITPVAYSRPLSTNHTHRFPPEQKVDYVISQSINHRSPSPPSYRLSRARSRSPSPYQRIGNSLDRPTSRQYYLHDNHY